VIIRRLPSGRPILVARSVCDHCGRKLRARDLIPVFAWAIRKGKCWHCGGDVGIFYPAVELAALGVAVWSLLVLPGWIAWVGAALGWALIALAWIDQRTFLLPDKLTLPLAAGGLVVAWLIDARILGDHLVGAALGLSVATVVAALYRRIRGRDGLGMGDAKLIGALGTWVAWQGLPTVVLYGALSGLVWVLVLGAWRRPQLLAARLPFGPHLCLGGWLVWLYGPLEFG
jgi:leader peptidase (prepilin peptidase)/N-methyltransferase